MEGHVLSTQNVEEFLNGNEHGSIHLILEAIDIIEMAENCMSMNNEDQTPKQKEDDYVENFTLFKRFIFIVLLTILKGLNNWECLQFFNPALR